MVLYVTYPETRTEEGFEIPYYDETNPLNYLRMQAGIEEILQSIRFGEGVAVLDTAPGYAALGERP